MSNFPLAAIHRRLVEEAGFSADITLEPLADTGLAHWHARICGRGLIVRAPKQSQMRLGASDNLAYQRACFKACEPSGATPKYHGIMSPCDDLPLGALIVEEIVGRPAELPRTLPAIAEALAAIHSCRETEAGRRLFRPADPLGAMMTEIETQADHLPSAQLPGDVLETIDGELALARAAIPSAGVPSPGLISFDAHPGNFLVQADGKAVLVDLEKARISLPGFDLAHATLYTSTTWDPSVYAVLETSDVIAFYEKWSAAAGAVAARQHGLHALTRRLMWLWSVTWCAKWRVTSAREKQDAGALEANAEDWSSENSEAALIAHVRDRVDDYLSRETVDQVRQELALFDKFSAITSF